jgi:hypothetical protein
MRAWGLAEKCGRDEEDAEDAGKVLKERGATGQRRKLREGRRKSRRGTRKRVKEERARYTGVEE